MTLESHLGSVLNQLLNPDNPQKTISSEQLIKCLDLTTLEEHAKDETINALNDKAKSHSVAAVCVLPKHLPLLEELKDTNIATVINFPNGTDTVKVSIQKIVEAKSHGANEIDYVFPYQAYLSGKKEEALSNCQEIQAFCTQEKLSLKIILETGIFPDMKSIFDASTELTKIGCQFIKTSTGKIPQGATLASVFAILCALRDSPNVVGLKVSGGVKTAQQAINYARLAELIMNKEINNQWFRLGSSSLLDELL